MRDRNEIVLVLLLVLGLAAGCQPAPMDAAAGAWPPGGQRLVRPCQDAAADLGAWLSTLADDPARAEPPAASAIDGQLRAIAEQADADSAVELVRLAAVLVQDCPQVEAAFRETLQTPRAERARILAERAAPALASCGCSLDLSAMKALLWTYVTGRQPDVGLAAASDLRAPARV